jgi:hypothetical protein
MLIQSHSTEPVLGSSSLKALSSTARFQQLAPDKTPQTLIDAPSNCLSACTYSISALRPASVIR